MVECSTRKVVSSNPHPDMEALGKASHSPAHELLCCCCFSFLSILLLVQDQNDHLMQNSKFKFGGFHKFCFCSLISVVLTFEEVQYFSVYLRTLFNTQYNTLVNSLLCVYDI